MEPPRDYPTVRSGYLISIYVARDSQCGFPCVSIIAGRVASERNYFIFASYLHLGRPPNSFHLFTRLSYAFFSSFCTV